MGKNVSCQSGLESSGANVSSSLRPTSDNTGLSCECNAARYEILLSSRKALPFRSSPHSIAPGAPPRSLLPRAGRTLRPRPRKRGEPASNLSGDGGETGGGNGYDGGGGDAAVAGSI
ncbi:hypothetical protein KM043_009483 [Ampulex compressa]|nr:hypothetical protein KM043_009483 [Ampulex compressa]